MYLWWIPHFSVCTMSSVDHHSRVILCRPRLCRQWPRGAPFPGARCRGRAVPPPPSRRLSRRPRSLSQGARQNPPVLRQRPGPVMPWHPIPFKNELCGPGRPDLCPLLTCGPHFERPAPRTWPSLPFFAHLPPAPQPCAPGQLGFRLPWRLTRTSRVIYSTWLTPQLSVVIRELTRVTSVSPLAGKLPEARAIRSPWCLRLAQCRACSSRCFTNVV